MLSVASSSHACRERVGGDSEHRRSQVRGDHRGVRGGDSHAGEGPGATTLTDLVDTAPAQGKCRCITPYFL